VERKARIDLKKQRLTAANSSCPALQWWYQAIAHRSREIRARRIPSAVQAIDPGMMVSACAMFVNGTVTVLSLTETLAVHVPPLPARPEPAMIRR
jgi:hypothetical protein